MASSGASFPPSEKVCEGGQGGHRQTRHANRERRRQQSEMIANYSSPHKRSRWGSPPQTDALSIQCHTPGIYNTLLIAIAHISGRFSNPIFSKAWAVHTSKMMALEICRGGLSIDVSLGIYALSVVDQSSEEIRPSGHVILLEVSHGRPVQTLHGELCCCCSHALPREYYAWMIRYYCRVVIIRQNKKKTQLCSLLAACDSGKLSWRQSRLWPYFQLSAAAAAAAAACATATSVWSRHHIFLYRH